jgi:hypothetical protein
MIFININAEIYTRSYIIIFVLSEYIHLSTYSNRILFLNRNSSALRMVVCLFPDLEIRLPESEAATLPVFSRRWAGRHHHWRPVYHEKLGQPLIVNL